MTPSIHKHSSQNAIIHQEQEQEQARMQTLAEHVERVMKHFIHSLYMYTVYIWQPINRNISDDSSKNVRLIERHRVTF
jgi:hypothetical protein